MTTQTGLFGGAGGSGADIGEVGDIYPYREKDYPPSPIDDDNIISKLIIDWKSSGGSNIPLMSVYEEVYSTMGDYAIICFSEQTSISSCRNDYIISKNGGVYRSIDFSTAKGGRAGYICSIIWDGIRFVMLHASDSSSGDLNIYWSDAGYDWYDPPNAAGAIFTIDTNATHRLIKGNKLGELMLIYYSAAELDGKTNEYHSAHSLDGFNVANLNDVSIKRSTNQPNTDFSCYSFKIKDAWLSLLGTFNYANHRITLDDGVTWADKQIAGSGSITICAYGVKEGIGAFIVADNARAWTKNGVDWEYSTTGARGLYSSRLMRHSAIYSNGCFYLSTRSGNNAEIVECDEQGKSYHYQAVSSYGGELLAKFRGYWSYWCYGQNYTRLLKE